MKKKEKILREISRLAKQMFGNGGGSVYLYGSQARDEATMQSDWDLLVITDDHLSPHDGDEFMQFSFPFMEMGWKLGAQITPIHYSRSQWDAQRDTLFYHNVITEGIRL